MKGRLEVFVVKTRGTQVGPDHWMRLRVFFYDDDPGRCLGWIVIQTRVYWSEQEIIERALQHVHLEAYENVCFEAA